MCVCERERQTNRQNHVDYSFQVSSLEFDRHLLASHKNILIILYDLGSANYNMHYKSILSYFFPKISCLIGNTDSRSYGCIVPQHLSVLEEIERKRRNGYENINLHGFIFQCHLRNTTIQF